MVSSVPAVIAAVSALQLVSSGAFDTMCDFFFSLAIPSQIALLAILFSIVFLSVEISQFVDPLGEHKDHHDHQSPITSAASSDYPLEEIRKAETDKEKFLTLYPVLRTQILNHLSTAHEQPPSAVEWVRNMMDYTVPGGKLNRGITVIDVHRIMIRHKHNRDLTETEVAKASVLGWAIEYLQAFFLVADDVMDDSKMRRGKPCWYENSHVKMIAINDSFLLESFVFTLLKLHFGKEEYYGKLVNLFIQVIQQTECGQLLDLTSQDVDQTKVDLSKFSMDRYRKIVKYKTAFYTFYLPIAIGMITSKVVDEEAFDLTRVVCCKIGEYFQIQDDYLDCFGDPEVIGKIGTDIQDNKCSWLVVQALDRVNDHQRSILQQNYGVDDANKIANVKAIYKDLDLEKAYHDYEENIYQEIQKDLDKVVRLVPRDVFNLSLKKIYKRDK